jgi:hypothetical protein
MARMRMVKPEMRKSLTVSAWPIAVRWTFVGLLGYLDDHGRGLDELRLLKAELYPLDDDMTARKIDNHIATLVDNGPVCRYSVDGKRFLHITSWTEHQKVSHAADSRIPPCPIHDKAGNDSGTPPEVLRNDSGTPPPRVRAGARGSGNREQGTGIAPERAAQEEPPKARARDELFDAVAAACEIDPAAITASGRGAINASLKQLREVDATPGQVTLRARAYRTRYRDAPLTPAALAKHWGSLSSAAAAPADSAAWAR